MLKGFFHKADDKTLGSALHLTWPFLPWRYLEPHFHGLILIIQLLFLILVSEVSIKV